MYNKILVVVDDREVAQSAIHHAIKMAQVHRADLLFFYVLPHYELASFDMLPVADLSSDEFRNKARAQAQHVLTTARRLAEQAGVHSFQSMSSDKVDTQSVADIAARKHCDLIVLATEDSNAMMRIFNGSLIPGLISVATVPVLVCHDVGLANGLSRRIHPLERARQRRLETLERRHREDND
jgi:nucleotide-binding universal stress UspA family protein